MRDRIVSGDLPLQILFPSLVWELFSIISRHIPQYVKILTLFGGMLLPEEFSDFSGGCGFHACDGDMMAESQIPDYSWVAVLPDRFTSACVFIESKVAAFIKCNVGVELIPEDLYFCELFVDRVI